MSFWIFTALHDMGKKDENFSTKPFHFLRLKNFLRQNRVVVRIAGFKYDPCHLLAV